MVLLYNVSDRESFEFYDMYLKANNQRKDYIALFVVACNDGNREVSYEEGMSLAQLAGASYYEVSLLNGVNCEVLFKDIAEQIIERKHRYREQLRRDFKQINRQFCKFNIIIITITLLYLILVMTFGISMFLFLSVVFFRSSYDVCPAEKTSIPAIAQVPLWISLILTLCIHFLPMISKSISWPKRKLALTVIALISTLCFLTLLILTLAKVLCAAYLLVVAQ